MNPRLLLASGARSFLHHRRGQKPAELRREAAGLLGRRERQRHELKEVGRDDSITPEDEAIGELLGRVRAANERLGKLKEQAEQQRRDELARLRRRCARDLPRPAQ